MNEFIGEPSKKRGSPDQSYLGKTIDEMIWEYMKENNIEGLAMAIVQAPYIPRVVGYGFSDAKRQLLASTNTMWPAGYITQGFTAVAIMQLYESGYLDIYDSIDCYLIDIPQSWKQITILELLRHSSGIADYSLRDGFNPEQQKDFVSLIKLVENEKLKFKPGTGVYQSATNFLLLAEIVEKASNKSYEQFIREKQIELLGLKQTGFLDEVDSFYHENVSASNNLHELFKDNKNYINPTEFAASYDNQGMQISMRESTGLKGYTDLWASAEDISFWDIALAGSILIHSPQNRDLIYEPWKEPSTGKMIPEVAGWQFYHHKGLMDIKGTIKGYSAYLSRFTAADELVCVTLMTNKEGIEFTNLARRIAAAYSGSIATGYNDNKLYLLESQFSVEEMSKRLVKELGNRSIPIFTIIDHKKNAQEVNLHLRSTIEVIFGSPSVGTFLMQEDQSISIALPLRISMWEDEMGSPWIGFQKTENMVEGYHITDLKIINAIENLLQNLVHRVSDIYCNIQ